MVSTLSEYHRKRAEMLAFVGDSCIDCAAQEGLQFDHADAGLKSFDISQNWGRSWETLRPELEKCVLRCGPCHTKKSLEHGDIPARVEHGTPGMYRHQKCRCSECVEANSKMQREYRERKKLRSVG